MPPDGGSRALILLRHGETAWNREQRIMGDADVPLSEEGRRQCACAGELLAGFSIDRIVTSPLARAAESARLIAQAIGGPVDEEPALAEVRFGSWQGRTYQEIAADPSYAEYVRDPERTPTPGGETIVDVQQRGLSALRRARPGQRTLFVSHGDVIRSVVCHYLAIPLSQYRRVRVDNCGLTAVIDTEGTTELKFVNLVADVERVWDSPHWANRVESTPVEGDDAKMP